MVVVDTNILAYLLIAGDRTDQARSLFARDSEWKSEAFILVEFSNILATYCRSNSMSVQAAERLLGSAERVMRTLVGVPHLVALQTARKFGVSAYDARFLAAAHSSRGRLITEDARLREAAPELTESLQHALSDG